MPSVRKPVDHSTQQTSGNVALKAAAAGAAVAAAASDPSGYPSAVAVGPPDVPSVPHEFSFEDYAKDFAVADAPPPKESDETYLWGGGDDDDVEDDEEPPWEILHAITEHRAKNIFIKDNNEVPSLDPSLDTKDVTSLNPYGISPRSPYGHFPAYTMRIKETPTVKNICDEMKFTHSQFKGKQEEQWYAAGFERVDPAKTTLRSGNTWKCVKGTVEGATDMPSVLSNRYLPELIEEVAKQIKLSDNYGEVSVYMGIPRKTTFWHQDNYGKNDIAVNLFRWNGKPGTSPSPTKLLIPLESGKEHMVGRFPPKTMRGFELKAQANYPTSTSDPCTLIQVFRNDLLWHVTPENTTQTENTEITALRFHHRDRHG